MSDPLLQPSQIEQEFDEFDRLAAWPILFQKLRNESLYEAENFNLRAARSPNNRCLNRYRDVAPYDHSRILLREGDTDYINASLVEGCRMDAPDGAEGVDAQKEASPDLALPMQPVHYRRYILTQGPLPTTACHFWQMVWEQNSTAIVMLNKVIEKAVTKCAQYWPIGEANGDHDSYLFEETGFRVTLLEKEDKHNFVVSRFLLEHVPSRQDREILHFHYTTWPDFGVPESPSAFLHFLLAVRKSGALDPSVGPPIVHCSAGIGRSGTFCLADSALVLVEEKRSLDSVDVHELLMRMRSFRMGLIQTFDQLRFSYMAIIEGGHRILNDQFTAEALSPETEDDSDEEDMEETDDSDQSESLEEDEDEVILTLANQVEKTEDEDDDEDGLPDISPPPPPLPKRIESLSPASERKFLLQAAAAATEAGRPEDGSDEEEDDSSSNLPAVPRKHNMELNVVKMARPGSTDTLSIDEGFVDLQTPVTDTEAPVKIVGPSPKSYLIRKRAAAATHSSLDSTPEEAPQTATPSASIAPPVTKDQQRMTEENSWKWFFLPLPVLFIGYVVYKCYYS